MAERTFDYEKIADIYNAMKKITGDASNPDSIAGILELANKEMDNKCGVENEALFGPVADQLSLDWDNFSSNFPNFVANFNNWATVVSTASGKYEEFEKAVSDQRKANPLGFASEGREMNYIEDSFYQKYAVDNYEQLENDLNALEGAELYALTGAEYVDTGSVAKLEAHRNKVKFVVGGFVASAVIGTVATVIASYVYAPATLKAIKGPVGWMARGLAHKLPGTKTARVEAYDAKIKAANAELEAAKKELAGAKNAEAMVEVDIEEGLESLSSGAQTQAANDVAFAESKVAAAQQQVDKLTQAQELVANGKYSEAAKLMGEPTMGDKVASGVQSVKSGTSKVVSGVKSGTSKVVGGVKTGATKLYNGVKTTVTNSGSKFSSVLKGLRGTKTTLNAAGTSVSTAKKAIGYASAGLGAITLYNLLKNRGR